MLRLLSFGRRLLASAASLGGFVSRARQGVTVTFEDCESDYFEVVPVRLRRGTVLRNVQKLLTDLADDPCWKEYQVSAHIVPASVVIQFTSGHREEAEHFATLLASSVGWQKDHGVYVGRAS